MKLKYIGNFDKLKDYGFTNHIDDPINSYIYEDEDECGFSYDGGYLAIGEERQICIVADADVWELGKLYDLIKDGLITKEEENEYHTSKSNKITR